MLKASQKKKFGVLIRGANYHFEAQGKTVRYGFYVTRLVIARDARSAEKQALNLIRRDAKLRKRILNPKSDSPMLYIERLAELSSWGGMKPTGSGYAFFQEARTSRKKLRKAGENKQSEQRKGRKRK